MGNVCNQVCTCCETDRKSKPNQLQSVQPIKMQIPAVQQQSPQFKQLHSSKYVLEQPADTFQVVTGDQYEDGPHPSNAKISYLPKLTKQQALVLQRQLPLKQENIKGSPLSCFFLTNKRIWYEGEWMKGLPHGKGKSFFETGTYFEGYFKNGFGNCNDGILIFPEGSYYRGPVVDSKLSGKGVYFNAYNRNWYRGQFENDKPSGFGFEQFANGNRYEGQFKDGYKHGKGKFTWKNGMTYEGDFKLGYMWGMGRLQKGKAFYDGEFERGKKVGRAGQLNTETGKYEGPFCDGLMNGRGQFRWNDGKVYVGDFLNGQLHGEGTLQYPNGQKIKGTWDKGFNTGIDEITGR